MIRQGRAGIPAWGVRLALAGVAVGSGCAIYHQQPLDPGAVLRAPSPARVEAQAVALKHPILAPLKVNLADGLSPDEAAVVAVVMSPKLRAERDRRNLARAQLFDAGLLPDPVLSGGQDFPVGGALQGTVPAWNAGLSLDLRAIVTRGARVGAAQHAVRQVDLEVAWAEWQVAEDARLAVFHLAFARRSAALMQQVAHSLDADLQARRKALIQGLASRIEVAAAEGDADTARETLAQLSGEVETARQTLDALLGLPPEHALKLQGDAAPAAWPQLPAMSVLLAHLDDRLDLVALRQGYESQEAKVRLAVLSQLPDVGISLGGAADTTNVITLGYGVSLSLPFLNGSRGRIAVARATRTMLKDAYAARRFAARAQVARIVAQLSALRRELAAAQASLPALERVADAYRKGLATGDVDLVSAHAAARRVWQTQVRILSLQAAVAARRVALTLAVGRPLGKDAA